MPNRFDFAVPTVGGGEPTTFHLNKGESLYLLGANGTGKSALVARLFNQHQGAKRIAAHRQTWFDSNFLDMTAKSREDLERNTRAQDAQERARYWEWNPTSRASMAIFDLINADTVQ